MKVIAPYNIPKYSVAQKAKLLFQEDRPTKSETPLYNQIDLAIM